MTRLVGIHRHPVKGFTAESLSSAYFAQGAGVPFDRHFAFVSGNKEDQPKPGSWVQPRTFLMLTLYPELARFDCKLSDDETTLRIVAPDGEAAQATRGAPETFDAVNALLAKHFDSGPHSNIRLVEQADKRGNWDFSDTEISIINLATVRLVSEAAGRDLEKERFRGNLYIDNLAPWEEFSWPGSRIRIGDAELDVLRPIQRCAMTSTEPGTGLREVDVPKSMSDAFGHNFCGVYARVVSSGAMSLDDNVTIEKSNVLQPRDHLPERAADPAIWPQYASVERLGNGDTVLTSTNDVWPLNTMQPGQKVRIHALVAGAVPQRLEVRENTGDGCVVSPEHELGDRVLVSGPYGRTK